MRRNLTGAPAYDDTTYWEARFARVAQRESGIGTVDAKRTQSSLQDAVEWLGDGGLLLDAFHEHVKSRGKDDEEAFYVHLGAGVSDLGLRMAECMLSSGLPLRALVNVDFSQSALHVGRARARSWAQARQGCDENMHFHLADLRSWSSLRQTFSTDRHANADRPSIRCILDKSTSDSIATGEQIDLASLNVQASEDLCPLVREQVPMLDPSIKSIKPLDLVALHLAGLTSANAIWAVLTFAHDRFDFLHRDKDAHRRRLSLSSAFWSIKEHRLTPAPSGSENPNAPMVNHHFFILQRLE